MTADGINEIAVYLSDVQNAAELASGVIEETAELSKPHRSMLKFYLGLWKRYRECFISGKLRAYNPENGYSLISGETDDKTAAAAYVKNYMDIKKSYS